MRSVSVALDQATLEAKERVPLVDANNNRIGGVPKTEAHKKGLLHPVVICEVHDSKGRWMLAKLAAHKLDANQFVNAMGGHVRTHETDDEALKREVFEELGLKDFKFKYKGKFVYDRTVNGNRENNLYLVYEVYCDDDPVLNDECIDFKWFTTEEISAGLKAKAAEFGEPLYKVIETIYPELLAR